MEDDLHTVAATAMGLAFIVGTITVMVRRGPPATAAHAIDAGAAGLALTHSLAMSALPDYEVSLQRPMFLMAYGWYGKEALRLGFPRTLMALHGGRAVG